MKKDVQSRTTNILGWVPALIMIIVITAGHSPPAYADEKGGRSGETILSAAEVDYPPFSFTDENGTVKGFSVELMREALDAMGRKVTFRTGPWAEVRTWLEQGEIDALPLVGRTPEREALFDFTVPYMSLHGAIVVKDDNTDIRKLEDLRGRRVAVMKGDNAEEFLRRRDRGIDIHTTPTFETALQKLSKGAYDAVLTQRLVALRLIRKTGLTDLHVIDRPVEGFRQDFCFAVREGDRETLALLNEGLSVVVADGTYRHLHSEWFASMQLPTDRPLIVGGDRNFPPYEFLDENGNPSGYNVDLTRAIAGEMGLNIEFRLGKWAERRKALANGTIDVVQGMFYSSARDLEFDFSQPHAVSHCVAVVRKGDGPAPAGLEDLSGKRIVVEQGDILHDFVLENGLKSNTSAVEDQEKALAELARGEHDCALVSRITALYLMDRHGWSNLVPGKKPILAPEYCYAVPKGRKAVLAQFSEGLKSLEKSGDYRRIREKWLGVYKESPTSAADALRYSAIVIIPLLLIICLAFIWTRSLRRKVAEKTKELMESEEYQRAMISCSPVALYTIDPDGRVLSWNNSAERIFGWRSEEIIGKKLPIVAEESKEEFNALLAKAANEGGFIRKELIRLKKDGTEFPVSLSVAPVRNDKGETVGILGAAEDITGQKQARLRIEHLNQVLRAIRDINQLIIRERDRSTLISEACRLLVANRGYRAAMIILINEEGGPESWAMQGIASDSSELAEMLEQGTLPSCCGHVPAEEGVLLVENRKTVCKSCPIADMCADSQSLCAELAHEGKSFGYLAAAAEKHLDVDSDEKNLFRETAEDFAYAVNVMNIENARKKFESEHEKLQSQLLQAQKMESVGRLAGGVAHDFNNMLSVITGYAELAVNEIPQENPLHSDLQEILNAARRSADITRQLLAFARQQAISPEVLDLNETVENMMKMLRRLIGEDIDLSWNPSPGLWCVRMDPSQLDQILANLCVNARDAIKDVGRITMETSNITFDEEYCSDHPGFKPGEYVLLAVSDNGRGMDRETSDKIFEPFFTTKEVGKGTGLGLAMIYGIVKQNNGFINVYSEVGRGTTFRIYLPRHKGDLQHSKVPAAKDVPRAGGETVLLVEDEPAILKLAGTILKRLGYKVLQTSSPIEAVSLAKEHTGEIDLLITDVVMPDMNGRDLAERLLTGYPEMKILYMSGYTSNAIAHHGVLDEGVNFLQKPFSSRDLGIRVRRALDS